MQKNSLKVAERGLAESLSKFGKQPLSELQISNAEHLLVKYCNKKQTKAMIFDDLRYEEYHLKAFNFDLEKLPPTSKTIYKDMKRVYYQCYM